MKIAMFSASLMCLLLEACSLEPSDTNQIDKPEVQLGSGLEESCEDPQGSTEMRRLSQKEYIYSMEDLLGIKAEPLIQFEKEIGIQGFHNNATALGYSQLLQDNLLQNSEKLISASWSNKNSRLWVCKEETTECANKMVDSLAENAYRRPLKSSEKETLHQILKGATNDYGFELGTKAALQYILNSPNFLLRGFEYTNPGSEQFQLASKLSYLLWHSIPDRTLSDLAKKGQLDASAVLPSQIDRMIKDPKSDRFIETFVNDWLDLDNLKAIKPDLKMYPDFNENLRNAMLIEIKMLVKDILFNERPIEELLSADYSYLNKTLASFYGLEGDFSEGFVKTKISDDLRKGLLLKAGILASTSVAEDSSVVQRGKWVLGNIFCRLPPNPPGNFELPEQDAEMPKSKRERFAEHRKNPACAGCHVEMDPIGFGLDNYDAVGNWRSHGIDGFEIDNEGVIAGTEFSGPSELRAIIAKEGVLVDCLTQKVATFSLGRVLSSGDQCRLQKISSGITQSSGTFSEIVKAYVASDLFFANGVKYE